ncbi:MAG: bifunctional oligoribonuclease/PAP phosphatase NrnA [Verrucomicrobia bacterium]|jgi:phosphoesterase RecJ-like protein|nr:bifunctional oligoribonuclease/PAP phosphatase NrnA [Verrucomicrobiota bacterium]
MDAALTRQISDCLASAKNPVLLTHIRPDGDAFGSLVGLGHALMDRGAKPKLFVEGGMIEMYRFLPGFDLVKDIPDAMPETDCLVALDTSTRERLGQKTISWSRPVDIVIDHHISNPGYGVLNLIVSEIPSTTGVLFKLFESAGWKISPAAATCLFTGLTTDTGSFRYRGTNADTLHIAAKLVELGADPSEIAKQCYLSITHERHALKRLVSNTLSLKDNKKSAFLTILPEFYAKSGAKSEDTEGIIEEVSSIQGVEIGSLFEFSSDGGLRVSLRSKGRVDVNAIASSFGGGGHKAAAGIRFTKEAEKNRDLVLAAISQAIASLKD